jgi:hypothetical protein
LHSKLFFESTFDDLSGAWSAPFELFSVSSIELDASLRCLLLQSIRRHAFKQLVDPKALWIADYLDVIKRPIDVGTLTHRLKRGLYGLVWDLLLDVELFMANATRSTSPPPFEAPTSGRGQRFISDGSRAATSPPLLPW